MSDHDRGPYTPPSERLAFDPREPVRSGPAPVTLIVSALVLLGVIGGVAWLYRDGFKQKPGPPATVGEPVAQMKTVNAIDAQGQPPSLVIDKSAGQAASNGVVAFAPPPEVPLRPAEPVPSPPPPAKVATAKPAKPLTIASLADAAVAAKPAPTPPKPAIAPVPTADAAPPSGATWVQIGALSSPALAEKAWNDIAKLEPAAMKGKGRQVQQVEVNGKTLYRTYITGFASRAAASGFCASVKAGGKDCFVK